jgi:hypothetical protein
VKAAEIAPRRSRRASAPRQVAARVSLSASQVKQLDALVARERAVTPARVTVDRSHTLYWVLSRGFLTCEANIAEREKALADAQQQQQRTTGAP